MKPITRFFTQQQKSSAWKRGPWFATTNHHVNSSFHFRSYSTTSGVKPTEEVNNNTVQLSTKEPQVVSSTQQQQQQVPITAIIEETTTTTTTEVKKEGFIATIRSLLRSKTSLINNMMLSGKTISPNAFLTIMFGAFRMKKVFEERRFEQRITISLNYVDPVDHTLKIRNIACDNLDEVFLHNYEAVHLIQTAAKKSTAEKPVVMLPHEDKWLLLNIIQTKISEQLSPEGFFLKDMQIPCKCEYYVFGITMEPDAQVKKLRVVIAKERLLVDILKQKYGPINIKPNSQNLVNNEDNDPECKTTAPTFEYRSGEARWKTLVQMARLYNAQHEAMSKTGVADLMKVEICLPIYL